MLILYGATAGVSVVKLYAGAFFPGIMLASLYVLFTIIMAVLNPKLAPRLPLAERNVPYGTIIWSLITSFLPLAGLIGAALGSIIAGLATPSEAAAMGSIGALLLAVGYGADYSRRWALLLIQAYGIFIGLVIVYMIVCSFTALDVDKHVLLVACVLTIVVAVALLPGTKFKLSQLTESVFLTTRTTAMVCWLFIGSFTFSAVFAYLGGHEVVEHFVMALNLNTTGFMILAQIIIFILGWPLEWTEIIVIFMPIFLPLLKTFHVDPVVLRPAGGAQYPDLVPVAAGGDGTILSQGRRAELGQHQRYLPRRHALYDHRHRLDDHALHVPADRAVAAQLHVQVGWPRAKEK